MVELALTLPVLLLCAALIVTLSLVGTARLAVENAAAEGARVLALTNDADRARTTALAAAAPLSAERLRVALDPSRPEERPRGALVRVLVRYDVRLPFAFVGLPAATVEAAAVRRMEYVP